MPQEGGLAKMEEAARKKEMAAKARRQALSAAEKTALGFARAAGFWQNIAEFSPAGFPFLQSLRPYCPEGQAINLRALPLPPPFCCDALFAHGLEALPQPQARAFARDFLPRAALKLRPGGIMVLIEKLAEAPLFEKSLLQKAELVWSETAFFPPAAAEAKAGAAKPLYAAHLIRNSAFMLA